MKRTPCIGVCSTTYGDFVCRGCKRFAHEVVGWNQFTEDQRATAWERLSVLLEQSIQDYLLISARRRSRGRYESPHELLECLKSELQEDPSQDLQTCLGRLNLATHAPHSSIQSLNELVLAIENAFLMRSEANYEHSYSTSLNAALRPNRQSSLGGD